MTTKAKWIIYGALALIAVLLIAIFSKNIVNGLENLFVKIAIYLIVFCAGWLLGRFGGKRRKTTNATPVTSPKRKSRIR